MSTTYSTLHPRLIQGISQFIKYRGETTLCKKDNHIFRLRPLTKSVCISFGIWVENDKLIITSKDNDVTFDDIKPHIKKIKRVDLRYYRVPHYCSVFDLIKQLQTHKISINFDILELYGCAFRGKIINKPFNGNFIDMGLYLVDAIHAEQLLATPIVYTKYVRSVHKISEINRDAVYNYIIERKRFHDYKPLRVLHGPLHESREFIANYIYHDVICYTWSSELNKYVANGL